MFVRRSRKGFTLVEMLIVMVIIAIVAAIVLPRILGAKQRANEANSRGSLDQLRKSVKEFEADVGAYPVNLSDVQQATAPSNGLFVTGTTVETRSLTTEQQAGYKGPYIDNTKTGELPICKINGKNDAATWVYSGAGATGDKVGKVILGIAGNDSNGTPYTDW